MNRESMSNTLSVAPNVFINNPPLGQPLSFAQSLDVHAENPGMGLHGLLKLLESYRNDTFGPRRGAVVAIPIQPRTPAGTTVSLIQAIANIIRRILWYPHAFLTVPACWLSSQSLSTEPTALG